MLAIVAVAFVSELVVTFVLGRWLGVAGSTQLALFGAIALALTIAPPVYFLVLRPLRKEGERRLAAERHARYADRLALTDSLTEVMNRRGIKSALLQTMAQADRYERPLSVVMMDLDGFKSVNDLYGHSVGDDVLQRASRVVGGQLRTTDRLGRFGGDEFLIVLPETRLAAARALSERIADALRTSRFEVRGRQLHLSASFGQVEFGRGESLQALLERVDRALYAAKGARSARPGKVAAPST
jgi:diguanylate cyclase (GGDEF)-like protein